MNFPVVMEVAGDEFEGGARISVVIWEGATQSGDTCELICSHTLNRIWKGRTDGTQTYLGAAFGSNGIPAPYGFTLKTISAGSLTVYIEQA